MPLEIKILDYGDIELESSFLVLGRDCGRTRRVLTLGFLILGGPYPVVIDTGYRSNQIMETLGMRGCIGPVSQGKSACRQIWWWASTISLTPPSSLRAREYARPPRGSIRRRRDRRQSARSR